MHVEILISFIESVKNLISIFTTLKFDVCALRLVGSICKPWRNASNYILSIFREIQYKLPTDDYSKLERELLLSNINNITGHNKYMMHLLKSCTTIDDYTYCLPYLNSKRETNCRIMMCSRNCCENLTPFDTISILCKSFSGIGYNDALRFKILEYLNCDDEEFICYLPLLVYNLKNDSGVIANFLIKRSMDNFALLNALYWELQLYSGENNIYNSVFDKLKNMLSNKVNEASFLKIIDGCFSR